MNRFSLFLLILTFISFTSFISCGPDEANLINSGSNGENEATELPTASMSEEELEEVKDKKFYKLADEEVSCQTMTGVEIIGFEITLMVIQDENVCFNQICSDLVECYKLSETSLEVSSDKQSIIHNEDIYYLEGTY